MRSLFDAYMPTKNKQCLIHFKDKKAEELRTYDQVKGLPEYAGRLSSDSILIDIDDQDQAEILMNIIEALQLNCLVIQTSRGKHFYFKNSAIEKCSTGSKLACGLTADIKVGSKNSYAVLKFDNKERFIEWDIEEGQEYDEIPKFIYPIKGVNTDFLNMEEGSRNQALFNYILTLQSNDFTVDEARETIRIINQYVIKDSLSENELEVILRSEAFKSESFFKGSTFLFDKFATFLKNNNHIVKIDGQLNIYREGVYTPDYEAIEKQMVKHISNLNKAKRNEVNAYLRLICDRVKQSDVNLIAFRNGIYNIMNDQFTDFTPETIITNKIDWNYNPTAYSELTDQTLDKIACYDDSIRKLLEEAIGACMYRSNTLAGGKAFILIGEKANGKSTFLDMVKTILGEDNISSLDMNELPERFKTAELSGKLANIGDDIDSEFISNTGVFKKLVTGERLNVERKGQDPFEFNNYAKLLFSANNIPRLGRGKDNGAIVRRLVIVPFNAKFSPDDSDYRPSIKYDLRHSDSVEYMIQLGLAGLKRVLQNKAFTKSEKVEKELEEYSVTNNPMIGFIQECKTEDFVIENQPTNKVYKHYCEYCISNGHQAVSKIEFSKLVNRLMNFETKVAKISGQVVRVFVSRAVE